MQSAKFFTKCFRGSFALALLAGTLAGCAASPDAKRQPASLDPGARPQAEAPTKSATDTYPYTVANPYEGAFAQGTFGASDLPAPDTPPRPAGAITITLLLPMSSADEDVRALANTLLQAAQLALFDVARARASFARGMTGRRSTHKPRRGWRWRRVLI